MKRRRRQLAGVRPYATSADFRERLADVKEEPARFERTAAQLQAAVDKLAARGDGWNAGRKVFIADVAKELGTSPAAIAGPLLIANNRGWVELARADMPAGMDARTVAASEVEGPNGTATYHFVVAKSGALRGSVGSRAMKCVKIKNPLSSFDRRSIRTLKRGMATILVGCPRGQWAPRKQRCKVGMRAYETITPGRCKRGAGGKTKRA